MASIAPNKKSGKIAPKKKFKFWRTCKLPSCGREFGTNRSWQYFCPKDDDHNCQQEWHRLLRKKHEDMIVEVAILKKRMDAVEKRLEVK